MTLMDGGLVEISRTTITGVDLLPALINVPVDYWVCRFIMVVLV